MFAPMKVYFFFVSIQNWRAGDEIFFFLSFTIHNIECLILRVDVTVVVCFKSFSKLCETISDILMGFLMSIYRVYVCFFLCLFFVYCFQSKYDVNNFIVAIGGEVFINQCFSRVSFCYAYAHKFDS